MDMLYRCCAGADVHKRTVEVCVRRAEDGSRLRVTTRQFGTMTRHLLALADWLASEGVTDFDRYRVDPSQPLQVDFFVPDNMPPPKGVSLGAKN